MGRVSQPYFLVPLPSVPGLTECFTVDPWRPDTPHSQYGAKNRTDTILRPFKLIPSTCLASLSYGILSLRIHCSTLPQPFTVDRTDAVHHYDENGLANHSAEPPEIQAIHQEEVEFVTAWLADWVKPSNATSV